MGENQLAALNYETDKGQVKLSPMIVRKYLVNGNGTVTDQEVTMFLALCKYQKLNPFLREAYLIKFGQEAATIVTGKEVFTKRAAKIKECAGWKAGVIVTGKNGELIKRPGTLVLKDEELVGGWCTVWRHDWKEPMENEVSLLEYGRTNKDGKPMASWGRMPATMIRKVAIVQALRDTFPEDFQGMYSPEEMPVDVNQLAEKPVEVAEETEKATVIDTEITEEQLGNMTVEEIANITLSFGEHKGLTLGEVYKKHYGFVLRFLKIGRDGVIKSAFEILQKAADEAQKTKAEEAPLVDADDPDLPFNSVECLPE